MDLDITLDRTSGVLLSHQVGRRIIDLISGGALKIGARLPSSRALARQLGVARMTIVEAYGWLADQGYVESRHGSGTTIRRLELSKASGPARSRQQSVADDDETEGPWPIDFRLGVPDLASFPRQQWLSALTRTLRTASAAELNYGDPLGQPRLRKAIAAYLYRSRGFAVAPRNVVVTAGAAQAIDLMIRMLPEHREIVIETPGPAAQRALPFVYGVTLRETPVDDKGLRTDLLPDGDGVRRFAFVIPSHQLPTGCALSIERRLELIAWATRNDAFIIEDDYDSEFAFNGRPGVPLAKLDRSGRVIYTGTFSKTLAPSLRLGFMVAPDELIGKIRDLKWWADHGGASLSQNALAYWIDEGMFERHIQKMRKLYRDRFNHLAEELKTRLGDRVRILGQPIGMHFTILVRTSTDVQTIVTRCRDQGVNVPPIDGEVPGARDDELAFAMGFGNLEISRLSKGAAVFCEAVLDAQASTKARSMT
jgi:GntR family transcriptional regulator/MocR family aminotransferase